MSERKVEFEKNSNKLSKIDYKVGGTQTSKDISLYNNNPGCQAGS